MGASAKSELLRNLLFIIFFVVGCFFIGNLFFFKKEKLQTKDHEIKQDQFTISNESQGPASVQEEVENDPLQKGEPVADYLIKHHASKESAPEDDVQAIQQLLQVVQSEIKNIDLRFLSTNESIVDVLLGKNRYKMKFVTRDPRLVNEQGQLIDRWKRPYFFHLNGPKDISVRSAGEDRTMFTEDDVFLGESFQR